jgi:hypothetical protein
VDIHKTVSRLGEPGHARRDFAGALCVPSFFFSATKQLGFCITGTTMCHSDDQLRVLRADAAQAYSTPKDFLLRQDGVHQAMPPPPTNYQRKSVRLDTASSPVKAQGIEGRFRLHDNNSQLSEFRKSQRNHIKKQVYETDISEVRDGEKAGYTNVDVALLEFILAPDSTTTAACVC